MKYSKAIVIVALATIAFAPLAFAQSADMVAPVIVSSDATVTDNVVVSAPTENQTLAAKLTSLQLQVADPSTGFIKRIILRFQIQQLQNELNIQQALQ